MADPGNRPQGGLIGVPALSVQQLVLLNLALVFVSMAVLWLRSVRLRDASIVDAFWGPGFAVIATVGAALSAGALPRRLLLAVLVVTWGIRLGAHIWRRNRGGGEDFRYAAMRASHGESFWWVSLFSVFLLQGSLMWFIALPVQIAQGARQPEALGWLDLLGATVWACGLAFEAIGDRQLARFKADPANRGRILDTGLWRYTRHPNYFGDALLWWGLWLVSASTPGALWTLPCPLLMTLLLVRVSGVHLLEATMAQRPGYAEYMRRTSAFLPRPPRRER